MKLEASNRAVIEKSYSAIRSMYRDARFWGDDKSVVELYNILQVSLSAEIHNRLMAVKTAENEASVRQLIRRYVIGVREGGVQWYGALPLLEEKIAKLSGCREKDEALISQYVSLHDDFMALASFRSFEHFCLFLEQGWDKKVWRPQLANFKGWFFYANQMVLDKKVQFIEKQMPTGRGKSLSDCFLISWIFGQNINADVIKVFGNKYNCVRAFETITSLMSDRKYAKVFPYYQQFNCKEENIFEIRKQKDGVFKLAGSQKPTNFLTVGKESKISGTRANYMFLDDITQAEDAGSMHMHNKDISTHLEVWERRKHSNNDFFIIASGTTYSIYDILSWLKKRYGSDNAVVDKRFKWTSVAKSNRLVKDGLSVFISIPALDLETDLSTYEEEYPTYQLRKMRDDDYETFMAMEQQMPQRPKDSPFYYTQLQEYTEIPRAGEFGRSDSCWAYLDGKRKGSDFCSMPIFSPIGDTHYLVDAFYDNRPMKECYSGIIAKIKQHRITRLTIENNINEGLKTLLERMLYEQGITFCKIDEIFNTAKKEVRIANAEADIKSNIKFPKIGLYARSAPIGKAMDEFYGYSYTKKVAHDDFTDSVAGYTECYISTKKSQLGVLSVFER